MVSIDLWESQNSSLRKKPVFYQIWNSSPNFLCFVTFAHLRRRASAFHPEGPRIPAPPGSPATALQSWRNDKKWQKWRTRASKTGQNAAAAKAQASISFNTSSGGPRGVYPDNYASKVARIAAKCSSHMHAIVCMQSAASTHLENFISHKRLKNHTYNLIPN